MRIAYSILLGQIVEATEVDYGDCATFQIVCPECREAIFKAGEYKGDGRQYFSHYAASKSDVRICELRVASYTELQIKEINAVNHEQQLKKFFETFQSGVLKWLYTDDPFVTDPNLAERVRKQIAWMVSRVSFLKICDWMRDNFKKEKADENMFPYLTNAIAEEETKFWIKQQVSFASDFFIHLHAPNSKKALAFMVALSIILNKHIKIREDLIGLSEKHLSKFIKSDATFSIKDGQIVLNHVILVICVLLMAIPYFNFLSEKPDEKIAKRNREFLYRSIDEFADIIDEELNK